MKTAIYPGTFDPITRGHMDVLGRGGAFVRPRDRGRWHQPAQGRVVFAPRARRNAARRIFEGAWNNVEAASFTGLTVDFARSVGASFIARGLRAVTDFEHEMALVLANEQLDETIKTVFLMPSHRHLYLSSSVVRQAAELGAQVIPGSVPACVEAKLKEKFGF